MMATQTDGVVVRNERKRSIYYLLEIDCPSIATEIRPGQFIMLKVSGGNAPLLRRPFSIYNAFSAHHPDKEKRGHLLILYKKVGEGTQKMTELEPGKKVDLIGPLGNGFTLPARSPSTKIILVGGGAGIVCLYPLAEALRANPLFVLIGAKTQDHILCVEDFSKWTSDIYTATEDGSHGFKGTVVELLSAEREGFKDGEPWYMYASGPMRMIEELAKRVKWKGVLCQVSLEARMACGFGACWGCVVRTRDLRAPYQRVCKEGPVFNLEDVVWDHGEGF